jgi:hypothetical protein
MLRSVLVGLACGALIISAGPSQAAASCTGTINTVGINEAGDLYISLANVVVIHTVVVADELAAPVADKRLGTTPCAAVGEVEHHRLGRSNAPVQ